MNGRLLGAVPMALLLSACAHAYPDLATFQSVAPSDQSKELEPILAEAERLQGEYSLGYKDTARWQDISQLPVIGAAAAAAWILLKDQSGAAKKVGKIGIGTLTYTGARDQLSARGLPDAYIAGHGALTCVLSEGSVFHGSNALARFRLLQKSTSNIANDIGLVTRLRNTEPTNIGSYADALKAARTVADQAIASARTAESSALTQEAAFQSAAPTFRNAISSISVRVASKGRVRPPVEFAVLRDSMVAAAPKEPTDTRTTTESNSPQAAAMFSEALNVSDAPVLIQALAVATGDLISATARLSARTPSYTKSLGRVGEDCVKLAP